MRLWPLRRAALLPRDGVHMPAGAPAPAPTPRRARAAPRECLSTRAKQARMRERESNATRGRWLRCASFLHPPPPPHLLGYILVVLNTYNATIPWARPLPARGAARCGAECGDFVSVSRNRAVFFSFFCGVGAGRGSRPRLGARGWVGLGFWLWTTREK